MTKLNSGSFAGLQLHGYGVIYSDPPWRFLTYNKVKVTGRGKVKHYGTMPTADIAALPVGDLAADDCALFMSVHNAMFEAAFTVLSAWDFKFKSVAFVWTKVTKSGASHKGGGLTGTRSCTEQC
jgi:N6-adenosine-specific RNA methylase IME4